MSAQPALAEELTVVKLLITESVGFAAMAAGVDARLVEEIGQRYGHPDTEQLKEARRELERRVQAEAAPPPAPTPQRQTAPSAGKTATPPTARPVPRALASDLDQLLKQAAGSPHSRTRTLGKRIAELATDLRKRLDEESAEQRAEEAARQAAAKAQAEVDRLERELAQAKEKARQYNRGYRKPGRTEAAASPTNRKAPVGVSYTEVKQWARANGHKVGPGRPPRELVDAWREATTGGES